MQKINKKRFLIFFNFFLLLIACNSDEEGCLDIKANNYAPNADKNCCCVYPNIKLEINHLLDTVTFELGKSYQVNNPTLFQIDTLNFLFSNIHLQNNNRTLLVKDTLHIGVAPNERIVVEDNFVRISPKMSSYTIGSYHYPDTYTQLNMTFGLEDSLNLVVPDSVHTKDHPLQSKTPENWNYNENYVYLYMSVIPNILEPQQRKIIKITGSDARKHIHIPSNLTAKAGYDFEVQIQLRYDILFQGIDFVNSSENDIKNQLLNNISQAVKI